MHDWGDQLAMAGFADPVMDMEHITLSFDTPARLLAGCAGWGRNLHPQRFGGLRAPAWRRRLEAGGWTNGCGGRRCAARIDGSGIIYGHALRPSAQRGAPREGLGRCTARALVAREFRAGAQALRFVTERRDWSCESVKLVSNHAWKARRRGLPRCNDRRCVMRRTGRAWRDGSACCGPGVSGRRPTGERGRCLWKTWTR